MGQEEEREQKRQENIVRTIIILVGLVIVLLFYRASHSGAPIQVYNVEGNGSVPAVESKAEEKEESDEEDWLAPSGQPEEGFSVSGSETASFPEITSSDGGGEQEVLVEKSVDINRADQDELDKLPGIGPVLAERIIQYREENGGFFDIEELKSIEGIGDKTFEKIQDFVIVK